MSVKKISWLVIFVSILSGSAFASNSLDEAWSGKGILWSSAPKWESEQLQFYSIRTGQYDTGLPYAVSFSYTEQSDSFKIGAVRQYQYSENIHHYGELTWLRNNHNHMPEGYYRSLAGDVAAVATFYSARWLDLYEDIESLPFDPPLALEGPYVFEVWPGNILQIGEIHHDIPAARFYKLNTETLDLERISYPEDVLKEYYRSISTTDKSARVSYSVDANNIPHLSINMAYATGYQTQTTVAGRTATNYASGLAVVGVPVDRGLHFNLAMQGCVDPASNGYIRVEVWNDKGWWDSLWMTPAGELSKEKTIFCPAGGSCFVNKSFEGATEQERRLVQVFSSDNEFSADSLAGFNKHVAVHSLCDSPTNENPVTSSWVQLVLFR